MRSKHIVLRKQVLFNLILISILILSVFILLCIVFHYWNVNVIFVSLSKPSVTHKILKIALILFSLLAAINFFWHECFVANFPSAEDEEDREKNGSILDLGASLGVFIFASSILFVFYSTYFKEFVITTNNLFIFTRTFFLLFCYIIVLFEILITKQIFLLINNIRVNKRPEYERSLLKNFRRLIGFVSFLHLSFLFFCCIF